MPSIYDARFQEGGYLSRPQSLGLQEFGGMISQISQKQQEARFAIDTANFEMEQIKAMQDLEEQGKHDTGTGKDYIGDKQLESSLPDEEMRRYNERAAEIEMKYGEQGKAFIANHKVRHFGQVVNLHSRMKNIANVDYFQDMGVSMSRSVEGGQVTFDDAYATLNGLIDVAPVTPEVKSQIRDTTADMLTFSQYKSDMAKDPLFAIDKAKQKRYNTASLGQQARIDVDIESYVKSRAMTEISAANDAASMAFRHNGDPMAAKLAEQWGLHDVATQVKAAQSRAALIDRAVSGNLQDAAIVNSESIRRAVASNDPAQMALAMQVQGAISKRGQMVVQTPSMALVNEGVEVAEGDVSNPNVFVMARREIMQKVKDVFGIEPKFMGDGKDQEFTQMVMQSNVFERPAHVMGLARNLTDAERGKVSSELRDVNGNIAVMMAISPRGELIDPSVAQERMDLGVAVLSDIDKDYQPSDKDFSNYMARWESGVNWGDPGVKEPIRKAALSAYTYYAKQKGVVGFDEPLMNTVMDRLTGGRVEFADRRVTNFMLDNGAWADPDKFTESLDSAIDSGAVDGIYDSSGAPLSSKEIKKYGELVPTGENGVYKVRRKVSKVNNGVDVSYYEVYKGLDGSDFTIDMRQIYSMDSKSKYDLFMEGGLFK